MARLSLAGLTISLVVALLSCIAIIPAGHVGVAVVFGRVQARALGEGLNLINPFAVIENMSVRTETYTMSAVPTEGKVQGDDSIQALSSDGLLMPLDITVAYRLVGGDGPQIFRNIGPDFVDKIVRPAARTAVREAIAGFTAQESYSTQREQLARKMGEMLTQRLKDLLSQHSEFQGRSGFVIEQVMIRNVQLPPKVKDAIEEKLSAEQQALRMQFVLQKERQEAERKRIEAQGIADFQKIVAQGISEPLLEWKGIEATQQLAHSQNTKIVIIGNPKNGMPLIIPTDQR
jgi:regulator of protease activity HflC (stomatin/prohibitin superfamily)